MKLLALVGVAAAMEDACLTADNFANTQYTVRVGLGTPPQYLKAVPDTGSFELLAASTACSKTCGGGTHTLFDPNASSTYNNSGLATVLAYGQGEVGAALCNETIALGTLKVTDQNFLMMMVNRLKDWEAASYDAVMGIGPLATVSMEDPRPALMSSLGITTVGVCYGPSDGSPGRIDLGTGIPGIDYLWVPALGKQHWGVEINKVSVDGTPGEAGACSTAPYCAAIVDSGTSLIAVPDAILNDLSPVLDQVATDCSNMDKLPTIRLGIGDHAFELPPSLWVIKMKDVKEVKETQIGPFTMPYYTGKVEDECMPAFMSVNENTDHGPMIILGAPFLRAYAVAFDRSDPENRKMGYYPVPIGSRLCAGCDSAAVAPSPSPAAHADTELASAEPRKQHASQPLLPGEGPSSAAPAPRREVLAVSMASVRVPAWMRERRRTGRYEL